MNAIRRYTNSVEAFLHSDAGQRFFNIAYSVGAAIVIWGALFKILHVPGGNTLLCIGMGTEILMFILTAFDRPPKDPDWEKIVPALKSGSSATPLEGITIIDDSKSDIPLPSEKTESGILPQLPDAAKIEEVSEGFVDSMEEVTISLKLLEEQAAKMNLNMKEMNEMYERTLRAMKGEGGVH